TFPYLLKQGDYHESVGDLQEILLQEGYFDYAVTKYYGPITSAALKDFALNELGLDITGELFDHQLIQLVLKKAVKK
ncbi:MAG: peptidoglycan-binding protein, partial [Candidatus Gracilibacteria bacterium]|nr:peptidoglycan-binding protein [Candidatus Gracilibacteria bacterium]